MGIDYTLFIHSTHCREREEEDQGNYICMRESGILYAYVHFMLLVFILSRGEKSDPLSAVNFFSSSSFKEVEKEWLF